MPQLQQIISTPKGFAKAVGNRSALFATAMGCFFLSGLGIVMNILQLGQVSDWTLRYITRMFFRHDAVQFTGNSSRGEAFRYLWVYGPLVFIPLGLILLAIYLATRGNKGKAQFDAFQERGWVGRQLYIGLVLPVNNQQVQSVLISHPSIPDELFESYVADARNKISMLDKSARRPVVKQLSKAGVLAGKGAPATVIDPTFPAELTVAAVHGKTPFAVVIPPAAGGKIEVLTVKEKALS